MAMNVNPADVMFNELISAAVTGSVDILTSLLSRSSADIDRCDENDFTLLKTAIIIGNEGIVDALIKYGANVNFKGILNDSLYPIHIACMKGSSKIVQKLVENGASIESKDCNNRTSLHYAVFCQHIDVVELLIKRGADMNAINGKHIVLLNTFLHRVVENGNKSIVEVLLRSGANCNARTVINVVGSDNSAAVKKVERTPLSIAIKLGHTDIALFLIEQGADVNDVVEQRTMLEIACWKGSSEIAKCLLDNGVNVNSKNIVCISPLMVAVFYQHVDVVKLLITRGADVNAINGGLNDRLRTVLHTAVEEKNMSIVEVLLRSGADCNVCTVNNVVASDGLVVKVAKSTPLSIAIEHGHTDIALFLIKQGADVNAVVEYTTTMLDYACLKGSLEIVKHLLNNGANMNSRNAPLCLAIWSQHTDIALFLIEQGADVNAISEQRTVLDIACWKGSSEIVKSLIDKGANVNSRNLSNYSPLIHAITEQHFDIVKQLVLRDADVNGLNGGQKCTALHIAVKIGNKSIVEFLVDNGADCNARALGERKDGSVIPEDNGPTPLSVAIKAGHKDIALLLIDKGADVNNFVDDCPMLVLAIQETQDKQHRLELVRSLITHGADVNAKTLADVGQLKEEFNTTSKTELPKQYLQNVREGKTSDMTALFAACASGDEDIVAELLAHGAIVNDASWVGVTPLVIAIANHRIVIAGSYRSAAT